jgi:hypothetical protein
MEKRIVFHQPPAIKFRGCDFHLLKEEICIFPFLSRLKPFMASQDFLVILCVARPPGKSWANKIEFPGSECGSACDWIRIRF